MFSFCSPHEILGQETTPVVLTCGVSVLQDFLRPKAVLGGL